MTEGQEFLELKTYEEEVAYNEKNSSFTAQICYVFMAVLGGIGIMNLVNTLINSIYVRRRELGILQAIGLSERQMVRILQMEGLFTPAGRWPCLWAWGRWADTRCSSMPEKTGFWESSGITIPSDRRHSWRRRW